MPFARIGNADIADALPSGQPVRLGRGLQDRPCRRILASLFGHRDAACGVAGEAWTWRPRSDVTAELYITEQSRRWVSFRDPTMPSSGGTLDYLRMAAMWIPDWIGAFDPYLTDDVFMGCGGLLITHLPFRLTTHPAGPVRPKQTQQLRFARVQSHPCFPIDRHSEVGRSVSWSRLPSGPN
jgi:hypothetical protein